MTKCRLLMALAPVMPGLGFAWQTLLFLVVVVLCALPASALAQDPAAPPGPRIALLIVNSRYVTPADRLSGPLNDGLLLQRALKDAGFVGIDEDREPTLLTDRTRAQMREHLQAFRAALETAGPLAVGIVYFAGHGGADPQGTDNFLLPVDVPDVGRAAVREVGIGVRSITEQLEQIDADRRPAIVVVIDACRTPGGAASGTRGGAPVRPMVRPDNLLPKSMLVALSTGPGQAAPDNGPYAEVLAAKLKEHPGMPLAGLFDEVKREVARRTGAAQVPEHSSQILSETCIGRCEASGDVAGLKAALACSGLRPEDLALAVRARNGDRAVQVWQCRRESLTAAEVRSAFASLFRWSDFPRSEAFLEQLRKAGVRFLTDFRPANPDRPEEYGASPLRTAVMASNLRAIAWLSAGSEADAWAAYPALLAERFRRPAYGDADTRARTEETVERLRSAGLPSDFNQHEAFRHVYGAWLRTQFPPTYRSLGAGARSREWEALFGDLRPAEQADHWRRLARLLTPPADERAAVMQRAAADFAQPKLDIANRLQSELKSMLAGGGVRTINDPRHPLGARNADVAPGGLRDDDLAVDSYGLLSADGWAGVGAARAAVKQLAALQAELERVRTAPPSP